MGYQISYGQSGARKTKKWKMSAIKLEKTHYGLAETVRGFLQKTVYFEHQNERIRLLK